MFTVREFQEGIQEYQAGAAPQSGAQERALRQSRRAGAAAADFAQRVEQGEREEHQQLRI